jgi:VCBS repeat-containing protein
MLRTTDLTLLRLARRGARLACGLLVALLLSGFWLFTAPVARAETGFYNISPSTGSTQEVNPTFHLEVHPALVVDLGSDAATIDWGDGSIEHPTISLRCPSIGCYFRGPGWSIPLYTEWFDRTHNYHLQGTYYVKLTYKSWGIPYSVSWTVHSNSQVKPGKVALDVRYDPNQLTVDYTPKPVDGVFPELSQVQIMAMPKPGWRITSWQRTSEDVYDGDFYIDDDICPRYSTFCSITTERFEWPGTPNFHDEYYTIAAEPVAYVGISAGFGPTDVITTTNAASVGFLVRFHRTVSGLSASNFELVSGGGVSGASITSIINYSGDPREWMVTANTGSGDGTLGLRMVNANGLHALGLDQDGLVVEVANLPTQSQTYTIDRTRPTTTITASPPPLTSSNSASITFSSSETNSSYRCTLDGVELASCASPARLNGLADGNHVFMVCSIDPAGNACQEPAMASWTVDVIATNPDTYAIDEDTPLEVATPGVLANDRDAGAEPLTATLVDGPSHGTLALQADGSFRYTPAADYNGSDSFTYRASDGRLSPEAMVSITVNPVQDAPVVTEDSYVMSKDMPLAVAAPGVLANDRDADGDNLKVYLADKPHFGALALNRDGSFNYEPKPGYTGLDNFSYFVDDGATKSVPVVVTLRVGALIAGDDQYHTNESVSLTVAAPGVLANDTDLAGGADPLSAVLLSDPSHGKLVLEPDGSFSYRPTKGFSGDDSFSYVVSDGSLTSAPATVIITVQTIRGPLAVNDSYITAIDRPLIVERPGVLANDRSADQELTVLLDTRPDNGMLILKESGAFEYTPNTGFSGTDRFTYVIEGDEGKSNVATVTIVIKQ